MKAPIKKPTASGGQTETTPDTKQTRVPAVTGGRKHILIRGQFFRRYVGKLLAWLLKKEEKKQ